VRTPHLTFHISTSFQTRAYRYAFKLSYDQMVYGTGDTPSDMEESFKEYDEGWYMGAESSREWAGAVKEEVVSLEFASDLASETDVAMQMTLERVGSG
jgi:hypothetical protein